MHPIQRAGLVTLIFCLAHPVVARPSTLEHDPHSEVPAINPPVTTAPPGSEKPPVRLASPQYTDTLLMVRPVDFGFNAQTGADNVFEHLAKDDPSVVTGRAMQEFGAMVQKLRAAGINVLVLERAHRRHREKTPDAVFPNNWVTIDHHGAVMVFPMKTPNRRAETGRIADVMQLLHASGYVTHGRPTYVGNGSHHALEGTGAMVLDHRDKVAYAALSERCDAQLLEQYAHKQHYAAPVAFHTQGSGGKPFYHTNVMMSVGDGFAVVCDECIADAQERSRVLDDLRQTHELVDISLQQTEMHFCANILQVANNAGEPFIVMSQNAYNGFTEDQRRSLAKYGQLLPVDIHTIESVGGGSARCMMAEVFAPKATELPPPG